jgi:hypothetical protein
LGSTSLGLRLRTSRAPEGQLRPANVRAGPRSPGPGAVRSRSYATSLIGTGVQDQRANDAFLRASLRARGMRLRAARRFLRRAWLRSRVRLRRGIFGSDQPHQESASFRAVPRRSRTSRFGPRVARQFADAGAGCEGQTRPIAVGSASASTRRTRSLRDDHPRECLGPSSAFNNLRRSNDQCRE